MLRGMYTATTGMVSEMHRLDVVAQNLANVNVTGYKRTVSVEKCFPEQLLRRMSDDGILNNPFGSIDSAPVIGTIGTGVEQNEVYIDFSQGGFQETDHDFDMALQGHGFFVIDTPLGERYSRNGSFVINEQSMLVTTEGYPVLGEKGPIYVKANNFVVDQAGRIFQNERFVDPAERLVSKEENQWEDTEMVDRFKLVDFKRARYLEKQGASTYRANENTGEPQTLEGLERPSVRQGFLESSNVNPVIEMVRMIEINRAYEANQKCVQSEEGLAGRLINEVIKV